MAEGGYNISVNAQSSGRKKNETPDVKKKNKNPIHGVQKKWKRRKHGSKSTGDVTTGGNEQTPSTGGNSDYEDEHQEPPQTWADPVPIENASPSPSPPHPQLYPPVYDHKDTTQQKTQLSQPLHVQSQWKPLAKTGDYNCLDVIHNQQLPSQMAQSDIPPAHRPQVGTGEDYNRLGETIKEDQRRRHTQPLLMPNQVQSDSPYQFHSQLEQVTRELTKIELERDRLKEEIVEKDKRINEYEDKIVQYRTQIRQQQWIPSTGDGSQGTVVDITAQARIKELEQDLAHQTKDLLAKDVSLKTLEEDKDKAELKAETLETELTEKEEQLNNFKTKVEECNQSIADLQLELTKANSQVEEGKKSLSDLKLKFNEVKAQTNAQNAILDKRYRDTQKLYDDQQLEKQKLEEEFWKLKKQSDIDKKNSFTKGMKKSEEVWKASSDDLEAKIRKKEDEYSSLLTKYEVLKKKEREKDKEALDIKTNLDKEQEENKRLTEEVQRLEEECQKPALDAVRQLDAKEKQIQEITTIKDEKEQVATNLEKNVLQLQQQLMETKVALEQMTTKNSELEDELTDLKETTQSGVEDGAKASPYNSLNEKERHLEQLKQKDKTIEDLNGRILKLEIDKRAIADELHKTQKNLEGPSHNAIVSQVDEINKAHQDLEAKQRELERKDKEFEILTEQKKELQERLLRMQTDRQSGIVVQSDSPKPRSLPDQSNKLRQLEERCRHLQTHNGKLTVQLQQQQEQYKEQSKQQKELITELGQKIEELSNENTKQMEKLKQKETDAASKLQKMETMLKTNEEDLRLLREDNERKGNVIDCHLNVLKQKEEENEKLKITIAELEAAKGEHLGTLTDKLTEKEAKIIKQHDLLEDKREGIKVMKEVLATKDQELSDLNQQLEKTKIQLTAKDQEVSDLERQLKKTLVQMQDDNIAVNAKQLKIVELTEQLEVSKVEAAGYKEDFEQERQDREKMHMELTSKLTTSQGVARDLQQQLTISQDIARDLQQKLIQAIHDKEHETQTLKIAQQKEIEELRNQISILQEQKSTVEEVAGKLTKEEDKVKNLEEEKLVLTSQVNAYSRQCEDIKKRFEEKVGNLEEEKLVLTQQVKAYSRQCEELKKTMVQLQEKSKTLEEQVHHKERIATEVDELKAQVQNAELKAQSALDSKQHLLAAFQQEQKKVVELEGALSSLSSQMKLMEIENSKLLNANKTVVEKLKASNDQLSKLMSVLPPDYLRILDLPSTPAPVQLSSRPHSSTQMIRSNVGDTHYAHRRNDVRPPEVPPRPNVTSESHETYSLTQGEQATNQGGAQVVVNTPSNVIKQLPIQATMVSTNPPQYKEELSAGYAAPQLSAAQMKQFAIHAQRQRQQAVLNQQEEERLSLLEQQRKREEVLADQALQELEKAEKERVKKQGTHKPNTISQATPTSSNLAGIQSQSNTIGQMVGGAPEVIDDAKKSEDIPENELLQNIDQDIQYYANQVRDMTKRPTTAEVDIDEHSSLPYDPNLVCHKCGKRYHIGEIQKFKRHIKETCPNKK